MVAFLKAEGISKRFPGVQALADVDLHVAPGEVLAVVGENGAGKSTLMKVIAGVYEPDAGTIFLEGERVRFRDVPAAERQGIVLIHQELNLVEEIDVAGNIFLGREPTFGGFLRFVDRSIYAAAERITRRLGLVCSPRTRVGDLPVGQQQLVEIARALSLRSRLLILDEPTSSLTERETAFLFSALRDLKGQGIAILYISHRLREVEQIADRVLVLRDGCNAGQLERGDIHHDAIVRLMVGRDVRQFFQRTHRPAPGAAPVLEVAGLRWSTQQREPIDFCLRAGEIVGLAGLIGSGRSELAETIFGVRRRLSGTIGVNGRPVSIRHPADAIAAGIMLAPEDRRVQGLILSLPVSENVTLPSLRDVSSFGIVSLGRQRAISRELCERLNVRTPSIFQTAGLLSGGNQQKIVLAKWLSKKPRVLILDEPTRGIDVGAKSEIYALMDRLAGEGMAILMISSDLEEVLGMSDRVLVMHEGRLAGEAGERTEEAIMRLATGAQSSLQPRARES